MFERKTSSDAAFEMFVGALSTCAPHSWNGQRGIPELRQIVPTPGLQLNLLSSTTVAFLPDCQDGACYEDSVAEYLCEIEGKARQQSALEY